MPSTFTPLGVELMETGENAGTWGSKTNKNLNIIEQVSGGYTVQTLNSGSPAGAGASTTTLVKDDGETGATIATRVIIFGAVSPEAITGNKVVTFPVLTENFYLIKNSTSGAYTVELKAATGSGATVTWATDDKGWKLIYFDGVTTNTGVVDVGFGAATSPGGSNTYVQYNNSGAFGGDADLVWTAGTGLIINSQKELRLADTDDTHFVGMRSHTAVGTSYTLTWPQNAAGANDYVLTSQTDGTLAWVENSGGTAWQAVVTGATQAATAGNGYFIDTTLNECNLTLPGGTLGDEVSVVDYAGTFDTNKLTVTPDSGEKIQGNTADAVLEVSTERAGFTLAYSGSAQGWLLKNN